MPPATLPIVLLLLPSVMPARANPDCRQALTSQVPWELERETLSSKAAAAMKPVYGELTRVFPTSPKGLQLLYYISGAGVRPAGHDPIWSYTSTVGVFDLICSETSGGATEIRAEHETSAWLYFMVNSFPIRGLASFTTEMKFGRWELPLHLVGDLRVIESPTGLTSIYAFNAKGEQTFAGWYFSAIKTPPFRKLSWSELADVYRTYWSTKIDRSIKDLEESRAASQRAIQRVNADGSMSPKEREEFLRISETADAKTRSVIDTLRGYRGDMLRTTDAMKRRPDASSPAYVGFINDLLYDPKSLSAAPGTGYHVFVENREIFDRTVPTWKPQTVLVRLRRSNASAAKTAFFDRFEKEFDFNVLRQLSGLPAVAARATIAEIGSTPQGRASAGNPSGTLPAGSGADAAGAGFTEDFSGSVAGQAPSGWTVDSPQALVREFGGTKRLVLKGSRLAFPKQVNDFEMRRVALTLDPYWNDFGQWTLQVFDSRGGFLSSKSDKTPIFYRDRNSVGVRIVRDGALMTVYFNGTKVIEQSVLGEGIRWNFIGFGLSGSASAEAADEISIGNIRLK